MLLIFFLSLCDGMKKYRDLHQYDASHPMKTLYSLLKRQCKREMAPSGAPSHLSSDLPTSPPSKAGKRTSRTVKAGKCASMSMSRTAKAGKSARQGWLPLHLHPVLHLSWIIFQQLRRLCSPSLMGCLSLSTLRILLLNLCLTLKSMNRLLTIYGTVYSSNGYRSHGINCSLTVGG
jgi:hypothetical protein